MKRRRGKRAARFQAGDWKRLLDEAANDFQRKAPAEELTEQQKTANAVRRAEAKVGLSELTRARVQLCSNGIAPGNDETLRELTDPELRPAELTEQLPAEATTHRPERPLDLDDRQLREALRSACKGSAADLAGVRYEHLRVLMDDERAWREFHLLVREAYHGNPPMVRGAKHS